MAELTYPLASVLIALELPEPTVTSWAKRGFPGLVIDPSGRGRGRTRVLGWEAVQRLAFIKALNDAGIPIAGAARLADQCLLAMKHRPPIKTMTVYKAPGESLIAYNDEDVADKMARKGIQIPPPWTTLTLHVDSILKLTKEALGTPAADDVSTPAPKKRPRSRKAAPPKA